MRGLEQIPWLYDAVCAVAERTWLGEWRRWITAGARGRTLEVGCGTGRNLPRFPRGIPVVGLEPGWPSLRAARRRAPGVPLVQGRAEALPFRSQSFDTVVSSLTLCSVDEPPVALAEIRRVLAPDGTVRMMEHVRSTRSWKARLQDRLQPMWTWVSGGCHPNRETEAAVEAAGFTIDDARRVGRGDMRRFTARFGGRCDS